MGGVDTRIVQTSLRRLVDHQRFDRRDKRAGGEEPWPYTAPRNYGCEASVSCQPLVDGITQMFVVH